MLHGFATVSALQLLNLKKLYAAPSQYDYFIGVMPHSLALLKTQNDVSMHGETFQGYGNWRFNGPGSLSGLDAIKANIFVPRGLTYRVSSNVESVGHFQAQGAFLSGYPARGASTYDLLAGANNVTPPNSTVQTIDWMIAQKSGFQPIALGYRNRPAFNGAEAPHFFRAISWRDPSTAYYPVFDSAALLNQLKNQALCNSFTADPTQIQNQIAKCIERERLIERVQQQYATFYRTNRSNASAFERYIADFSLDLVTTRTTRTSLEAQNAQLRTKPSLCNLPVPTFSDPVPSTFSNQTYESKVRELNSVVAHAFKAGLTNAATLSLCLEDNHLRQHYIATSDIGRDGFTREQILAHGTGLREYMDSVTKGLVHLVAELKAQGIFERTLILVGGEQNDGNTHTATEAPVFVIDGKSGAWNGRDLGTVATGQATPETRPYSDLLLDILKKFGFEVAEFGSPLNVKGVGRGGLF